jgi:trans-aconitate methyltransferase
MFAMDLFAGTAAFYQQHRTCVPEAAAEFLDAAAPSRSPRRLLDLGTGTGLAVAALLGRFDHIIAVDADADLLAAAETSLRPALPDWAALTLVHSAAEVFTPPAGWQADLVTICRAFHWMDQPTVLSRLDTQVSPDGIVAILGNSSIWKSTTPWKIAVLSVVQEFLGERRRAGSGFYGRNDRRLFTEILAESAFHQLTEITVPSRHIRSADSVIGWLHSASFAAPHLFGDRLDEFDQAIRERLRDFGSDDTFIDETEFTVLVGRRP